MIGLEYVEDLTPKQERAIVALLSEHNIRKVAAVVEVKEQTIYRWLRTADFSRAYRRARREAFSQAIALTQRYAPLAVSTLAKVMADPESPPGAKVSAAVALLRFGRDGLELDDLAARIEAIEDAMKAGTARWSA